MLLIMMEKFINKSAKEEDILFLTTLKVYSYLILLSPVKNSEKTILYFTFIKLLKGDGFMND